MARKPITAASRWLELDGQRSSFLDRCRQYAGFTIPNLLTEEGRDQNNDSGAYDLNSVGAQAVIGLVNKLMMALFPNRPFFKLQAGDTAKALAQKEGIDEDTLKIILASGEQKAHEKMETLGLRPKLYELMKHLVVTGNALRVREKDGDRIVALDRYVIKRNYLGQWIELILHERVCFDELDEKVQELFSGKREYNPDSIVSFYRWIKKTGKRYEETQWVDGVELPEDFSGRYSEDTVPFFPEVWDLADKDNYGTGLVENYAGDFGAIAMLSKAELETAILISEFRWLVNPTGNTRVEDFEGKDNGAAVAGAKEDVFLMTASSKASDLQAITAAAATYINRLGIGFLMSKSMIRDAERVTAEEIRLLAQELESSLGGVYSRLASTLQTRLAHDLVGAVGVRLAGKDIEVLIVSGMAALSRQGDLEALRGCLQDLAGIAALPPQLQQLLDLNRLATVVIIGWGLNPKDVLLPPEVAAQRVQAAQQQQMQAEVAQAGGVAAAEAAAQPPQQ